MRTRVTCDNQPVVASLPRQAWGRQTPGHQASPGHPGRAILFLCAAFRNDATPPSHPAMSRCERWAGCRPDAREVLDVPPDLVGRAAVPRVAADLLDRAPGREGI